MKKTKLLVLTATIALGIGSSVKAALPHNAIIAGNQAYSLNYLESNGDVVNQQVMNNLNKLYYVNNNGDAVDIFSGASVPESQIVSNIGSTLTYYADASTVTKYTADLNNTFQTNGTTDPHSAVVDASYSYLSGASSGLKLVNFKIRNTSGVKDASYFVVSSSSSTPSTDNLTPIKNQVTFFSSNSSDPNKYITIYDSNKSPIYYGSVRIDYGLTDGSDTKTVVLKITPNNTQSITNDPGNLNGNITNNGLAAIDTNQKWIYYVNTADKNKLYKASVDGLDDYPISDDSVGYINVVENWVYYCNYSDKGKLYKVKIDGTGRQKISDNKVSYICVVGDNIFYSNHSDGGKLYVTNSSGTTALTRDAVSYVNAIGNSGGATLFYSNDSVGGKLYSLIYSTATSGVTTTKLTDVSAKYINAVSAYIVYYTSSDGKLYRLNGTNSTAINALTNVPTKSTGSTTSMTSKADKMSVVCIDGNQNIYYRSNVDGGKLYKLDSKYNGYKLVNDTADFINIIDSSSTTANNANKGYIYYSKSGKLYRIPIDTDGTAPAVAISKTKSTLKIKTIDTLPTVTTSDISSFNFPERISATMSDGTIQELIVNWDKENGKFSKGIYTYTGTVLGYGNKVTLKVSIATEMPNVSKVAVENNSGNKDTVTVSGLNSGDVVSVYTTADQVKPTKTAAASTSGVANVTGLALNPNGGTVYVTVTTAGKAESAKLAVAYQAEAPASFTIDAEGSTITGLKANQAYVIYMYDASITNDTKVDWNGSASATSIKNPSGITEPVKINATSDPNGTITLTSGSPSTTFRSIITDAATNAGKDMAFRIKQKGATNATDSSLSPAQTISQAKVPDEVTIDYASGLILGTTTNMRYAYSNPNVAGFDTSQWKDCSPNMTPVALNMNLQVWVGVKPSGTVLASDAKALALFAPPTLSGIVNGHIYSSDSQPTPTWTATDNTTGTTTTTVRSRIDLYDANKDESNWTVLQGTKDDNSIVNNGITKYSGVYSSDGKIPSGSEIDVKKLLALNSSSYNSDTVFAFVLSETKTNSATGKSGTAKVIIKFTVNSTQPAQVDVAMKEAKGIINAIDTYYTASPVWNHLAGTDENVNLYRIETPKPIPSSVNVNDFKNIAPIQYPNGPIKQPGYYKLAVIVTNTDNGAKTETDKYFIVDDTPVVAASVNANGSPIVTGQTYNGINIVPKVTASGSEKVYYSLDGKTSWSETFPASVTSTGVYVGTGADASNVKDIRLVSAQIMGDSGFYSPYTFGQQFSLNGNYTLKITTTNAINGAWVPSTYQFYVNSGVTSPEAPDVKISVSNDGSYVLTNAADMGHMAYSVDGGTNWNDISGTSYTIDKDLAKTIKPANGIRVKVKAYGSYSESKQELINVQKLDTPKGIDVSLTTSKTPGVEDSVTAAFALDASTTNISNITSCEYSVDGGTNWKDITALTVTDPAFIKDLPENAKDILVRQKATANGSGDTLNVPSDPISMGISKPNAPASIVVSTSSDGKTCSLSPNANLEYSYDGGIKWYSDANFDNSKLTASNGIRIRSVASGFNMPSNNLNITVAAAPTAAFSFDGTNPGKLTGVDSTMEYSLDGGNSFTPITDTTVDLSTHPFAANETIKVRVKGTANTAPGEIQTLKILAGPTAALTGLSVSGTTLSGTATTMQYSYTSDGSSGWTTCTATTTTLPTSVAGGGSVYVRTKATGLTLPGTTTQVTMPNP